MATEDDDDPLPEWAQVPATTLDQVPVLPTEDTPTAPHPVVAKLAAEEAARARRQHEEDVRWYALGQDDVLQALRAFLLRKGLTDVEIQHIVLEVSQGCTPI